MNNILIKDIADCERPYEKALELGIETLTDAELVATIIRSGTREQSVIDLANRVLNNHYLYKGLLGLNYMNRQELLNIKGIGQVKATQLLAISELAKRMNRQKFKLGVTFANPKSIADYYMEKCRFYTREKVFVLLFSTAHTLLKEVCISEGTVNLSLISTREIFVEALRTDAVFVVLVHNHPSGNSEPSVADINITKKVIEAGRILDINLSDHIIIGKDSYVSLLERGIIS